MENSIETQEIHKFPLQEGHKFICLDGLEHYNNKLLESITDKYSDLELITYSKLKEKRDQGLLTPGRLYRITDYTFTTIESETKSAEHQFDIIVEALSNNELSELAKAIQHEGDTYFNSNDLSAWQLWYDIDNDTDKYAWADSTNGKGVIYRMIDDKNNDCPYDFKNALFYTNRYTSNTTTDNYYYTFSYVVDNVLYDGTVESQAKNCYSNVMKKYLHSSKQHLNKNIFRNTTFETTSYCYLNTFEDNCSHNTFGDNCRCNTFGNYCSGITFGDNCRHNTFGDDCNRITFGTSCDNNEFGYNCSNSTFGNNCNRNTFGDACINNEFGINCDNNEFGYNCSNSTFGDNYNHNTFGESCSYNTFGDDCSGNTFGNNCNYNTFGNTCYYNTFEKYCSNNYFGSFCDGNTFGSGCYHNTFGNYCKTNTFGNYTSHENVTTSTQNRTLNNDRIVITLNDEYYDDETGAIVPIKHPDLSTQPSILPNKFMGQYVYEQLIPITRNSQVQELIDIAVDKPLFLSASTIGIYSTFNVDILSTKMENSDPASINTPMILIDKTLSTDVHKYLKVTYTDASQFVNKNSYSYTDDSSDIIPTNNLGIEFGIYHDGTDWVYDTNTDTLTLGRTTAVNNTKTRKVSTDTPEWDNNAFGIYETSYPSRYASTVKNLVINEGVTKIGDFVFDDCYNLTNITIPDSVVCIQSTAFENTAWYNNLPEDVIYLGKVLYKHNIDASNTTSFNVKEGTKGISDSAFEYVRELYDIYLPNSLQWIGSKAFAGCYELESITIPGSVYSIYPETFNGCTNLTNVTLNEGITGISEDSFYGCTSLPNIYLPNSLQWIGSKAFSGCTSLTSIEIPNSVTSINDGTFGICTSLTSIEIPNSVTSIGDNAFISCTSLTSIEIPNSVTSIGNYAFKDCTSLTSINIPYGITVINSMTFSNCENLTSIEIPNSVTSIGQSAFNYCTSLSSINIPASVKTIEGGAFSDCSNLSHLVLNNGLQTIDSSAFADCPLLNCTESTNAKVLTIPNSVTIIGNYAFYNTNFTSISTRAQVPPTIGENTFNARTFGTATLFVNADYENAYNTATNWSKFTYIKVDPATMTYANNQIAYMLTAPAAAELANRLLENFNTIAEANGVAVVGQQYNSDTQMWVCTFSNKLTEIPEDAFEQCLMLVNMILPNSIQVIRKNAFLNCQGLKTIKLPSNLRYIDSYAFSYCLCLSYIEIPKYVVNINDITTVFEYCRNLKTIIVTPTNTVYDSRNNCNAIIETTTNTLLVGCQNTVIPDSVTSIGSSPWIVDPSSEIIEYITDIRISKNITSIESDAFSNCPELRTIMVDPTNTVYDSRNNCNAIIETATNKLIVGCQNTVIPNNITGIGSYAFCENLTPSYIELPDSVTSIGNYAFHHSTLSEIKLNEGLTSIGDGAFQGCNLTSIEIPAGVTSIRQAAFNTRLTVVTCHIVTPPTYTGLLFSTYTKSNGILYVPAESVNAYKSAAGWSDFVNIHPILQTPPNNQIYYTGTISDDKTIAQICDAIAISNNVNSYIIDNTSEGGILIFNGDITVIPSAYYGKLTGISLPASVTTIETRAFINCTNLKRIVFSEGLTTIKQDAFYNTGLINIEIPASFNTIYQGAFSACNSLVNIKVDPANTVYDSRNNCNAIIETASNKLVTGCIETKIPNSVVAIHDYAFFGLSSMKDIPYMPNSVTSIGNYAFYKCSGVKHCILPRNLTSLGEYAFAYCNGITSINIPGSLTDTGAYAFAYCDGITSAKLEEGVEFIYSYTFTNCINLESIDLPSTLQGIDGYAFLNCKKLTSITIPDRVTYIGVGAFYNCTSLTSITISANVSQVPQQALYGCTGLTSITVKAVTPPTTNSSAFTNVSKSIPLYVPANSVNAYKAATGWKDFTNIKAIS